MSTEPSVAILGLGWLGEPLAVTLAGLGYRVAGTTTDAAKAERLRQAGIEAALWNINDPLPPAWPTALAADTLVLCVPPGKVSDYAATLGRVTALAARAGVRRLLFTSATSVYGGTGVKTEADTGPDSERGERMLAAELRVRASGIPRVLCLRLSGLVGGSREPGRFLAGRRFEGGEEPVNLVALEDLLRFIPAILAREDWPETLNVSAPHHPRRQDFYRQAAELRGLPPPDFDGGGEGKSIDGGALCRWLGLDYEVTDWFSWLAERKARG
ncbi:NAD-dependent dehydratase [Zobellella denitrificans]|jgi:nucleoside-diphosphate-sugar epimerase|uniref:NAD-dependent dehydratase n=1 Tax=Zobellella denitrificans TaxID=347534 RepID=A0A231N0B5_9GAMM|nr:NAD(P)-binding domain-containing protein [Zobellella denitrificans]ATG74878.1 NAD-dependent dehydratase [Zobellella denitrificans]OXS15695.1 NAD-dependent dehydratase [Zobellella denitrificans]